jgi:hypothetical protein
MPDERELERVQGDIRRVIESIKNGFAGPDLKVEWDALQERKAALQAKLDTSDAPPPLLHLGSRRSHPRPHRRHRPHAD